MIYNKENFRLVFMGTPDFAVASLKALVEDQFNIVGVITSPDKPAGRGKKITQSAVKEYALSQNLNILQPTNLKDTDFQDELKKLKADLQIIVAFRMLPESVWNMPPLGSINLHASLLPHYRGAAPINWAVINGEKETGASTFFLKHEIDTGDLIYQQKIVIKESDNAGIVHDNLMNIGAELLVKSANSIVLGEYKEIPQKQLINDELKHAPKIFKNDCKIDWSTPAQNIHNLIRGLSPYPAAWSELNDENNNISFKIFDSEIETKIHSMKNGEIITDNKSYIKIAVKTGFIIINELQLAGKKRMKTRDFLQGFNKLGEYKIN